MLIKLLLFPKVKFSRSFLWSDGFLGSVAEQGNHEELIEKKGHYYDLVQSQTGGVSYEKSSKNLIKKEEKTEKAEDVKAAEEKFEV